MTPCTIPTPSHLKSSSRKRSGPSPVLRIHRRPVLQQGQQAGLVGTQCGDVQRSAAQRVGGVDVGARLDS